MGEWWERRHELGGRTHAPGLKRGRKPRAEGRAGVKALHMEGTPWLGKLRVGRIPELAGLGPKPRSNPTMFNVG